MIGRKWTVKIIVTVIFISMLTVCMGCNGSVETDEIGYVIAVGVDKTDTEGLIKVTYQIALPRILGAEGGKADVETSRIMTITAANLAEARNLSNAKLSVRLNLSHIKTIIIGEQLARQGVADIFGPIKRFREYRGSMFVLVVNGTAEEYIKNNKPIFDITPAKYYELVEASHEEVGYYAQTSLHQFYTRLKSKNGEASATLVGLNKSSAEQPKQAQKEMPGQKTAPYIAGKMPIDGGNPVEQVGTAIFRGEKMVGKLDNLETRSFLMLLGAFKNSYLIVQDPLAPKYKVNIIIKQAENPQIIASWEDNKPKLNVTIYLEGDITSIPSGINYEEGEYKTMLENSMSATVQQDVNQMLRHTQELGSDIVGFGYYFRPLFNTYQEYEQFNWNNRYTDSEIFVAVQVKIRRTGLMGRTLPMSAN